MMLNFFQSIKGSKSQIVQIKLCIDREMYFIASVISFFITNLNIEEI